MIPFLLNSTLGKLVGIATIVGKSTFYLSYTIAKMLVAIPSLAWQVLAKLYALIATRFAEFRSSSLTEYTFFWSCL